jgi:hypothetical protein
MKRLVILVVVMAGALAPWTAFGESATHGKTRAQVQAELIQARNAGTFDEPDSTYPAGQMRAATAQSVGGASSGGSESRLSPAAAPEGRDSIFFGQ